MTTHFDLSRFAAPPLELLDVSRPVVIYGAGNCGRAMSRSLAARGFRVLGFIDREKRGAVNDLTCHAPEDAWAQAARDDGATLVVGVWNFAVDIALLQSELAARDWQKVVAYPEWIETFDAPIEPFWLERRELYQQGETQEQWSQAAALWADEQSSDLFERALKSRLSADLEPLNAPLRNSIIRPYFAPDISGWPSPRRFVDCGAFDGDTLRCLPDETESIAAFEPDADNFRALAQQTQTSTIPTMLWPCGVWSKTTRLRFNSRGAASRPDDAGEIVPVVALDEVLHGFAPDFIKMDIEGAEPQALQGARRLIETNRPALAVCVYHRAAHLWQIVLELHSWRLNYDFFLRAHGFNGFDWVLYARPRSD